ALRPSHERTRSSRGCPEEGRAPCRRSGPEEQRSSRTYQRLQHPGGPLMSLETATYIADLVATNPTSADPKSQGDDHLGLLKTVLQATFAGFAGPILLVGTEPQGATASDYGVTVSPGPAAGVNRMLVLFKATHTNAGAATFKVNALTATPLVGVDQAA